MLNGKKLNWVGGSGGLKPTTRSSEDALGIGLR